MASLRALVRRHDIEFRNLHGESQSSDISRLQTILGEYKPRDTFNADETALFWKALPKKIFDGEI